MGGAQIIAETSINVLINGEDQVDRPRSSSEGILRARTLRKGFELQPKSDKIFSYDSEFTGRRALIDNPREFIGGSCRNRLQEKPDH